MNKWKPTHRHKRIPDYDVMIAEVPLPIGGPLIVAVYDTGGYSMLSSKLVELDFDPLSVATAEMPEPLVVGGDEIAYCVQLSDGTRMVMTYEGFWGATIVAALAEWLPRALAWQRGALP